MCINSSIQKPFYQILSLRLKVRGLTAALKKRLTRLLHLFKGNIKIPRINLYKGLYESIRQSFDHLIAPYTQKCTHSRELQRATKCVHDALLKKEALSPLPALRGLGRSSRPLWVIILTQHTYSRIARITSRLLAFISQSPSLLI